MTLYRFSRLADLTVLQISVIQDCGLSNFVIHWILAAASHLW